MKARYERTLIFWSPSSFNKIIIIINICGVCPVLTMVSMDMHFQLYQLNNIFSFSLNKNIV